MGGRVGPGRGGSVEARAIWELDDERVAEGLDVWVTAPEPGSTACGSSSAVWAVRRIEEATFHDPGRAGDA